MYGNITYKTERIAEVQMFNTGGYSDEELITKAAQIAGYRPDEWLTYDTAEHKDPRLVSFIKDFSE